MFLVRFSNGIEVRCTYDEVKSILERGETIHVWDIEMGYDLGIIRRR